METLKNWHFARILRVLIAVMLFGIAFYERSFFYGVFGVIMMYQAIMNIGCWGQRTCAINTNLVENQKINKDDLVIKE
jgi:hypothetical protein